MFEPKTTDFRVHHNKGMPEDQLSVQSLQKLVKKMERTGYFLVREGDSGAANALFFAVAALERSGHCSTISPAARLSVVPDSVTPDTV